MVVIVLVVVAYVAIVTGAILTGGTMLEVSTVNIMSFYVLVHYQAAVIVIMYTVSRVIQLLCMMTVLLG